MRKEKQSRSKRGITRHKMRGGSAGRVLIFYHIFCNEHTLEVVRDQMMKIIFSGLFDRVDKIYCFITGKRGMIDPVKSFLESLPAKCEVKDIGIDDKTFERFTLSRIKGLVHPNDKFLYMHSKGVTRSSNVDEADGVFYWRTYIEYYLIKNYAKCLEMLNNHDVVGVLYREMLIGPHYSGNFWWSTGAYYHKLTNKHKIGNLYYDTEAYLFRGSPNAKNIDNDVMPNDTHLYAEYIYPKTYMRGGIE